MNYWEIIADNLSKAGWSWGCVATVDATGRTIFVADAHRGGEAEDQSDGRAATTAVRREARGNLLSRQLCV